MHSRKELKKQARIMVKKHYLLLVVVCLIAAFFGVEFNGSLAIINFQTKEGVQAQNAGAIEKVTALDAVIKVLSGDENGGREIANSLRQEAIENSKEGTGNPALGRSRGVFADMVNSVTSGSFFITVIVAINSLIKNTNITLGICIVFTLLFYFFLHFFLKNVYLVISRRIFLESRIYEKVPIQRFAFLIRIKKWAKVAFNMFVLAVFKILWNFTIIGGIIKYFSYYLVPYIVAENPTISSLEAITLSRKMMVGYKWKCFLFELSYLGWSILASLTFGLSAIFYSNPYKLAGFSEFYVEIRKSAKEKHIEGIDILNDNYLFEKPENEVLTNTYADVLALEKEETQFEEEEKRRSIFEKIAEFFGLAFLSEKEEKLLEEKEIHLLGLHLGKENLEGKCYPARLSSIPEHLKRKKVETLRYLRDYSVWSLIMIFFIFSIGGWIWEVSLHLMTSGKLVNRGVLSGPWLPIYGSGSILILMCLNKLRKNPFLEFIGIILLCGVMEYLTSYVLETLHQGKRWWNYNGYFLNLHGRICAEGLLLFGMGGMIIVYLFAPLLDDFLKLIPRQWIIAMCIVLMFLFCTDQAYSVKHPNEGKGITSKTVAVVIQQTNEKG